MALARGGSNDFIPTISAMDCMALRAFRRALRIVTLRLSWPPVGGRSMEPE